MEDFLDLVPSLAPIVSSMSPIIPSMAPIPGSSTGFDNRMIVANNAGCMEYSNEGSTGYLGTLRNNTGDMITDELQGNLHQVQSINDQNPHETRSGVLPGILSSADDQSLQINWDAYIRSCQTNMAPAYYFLEKNSTGDVPGLDPGMKLEAIDRGNPQSFCVATVVQVVGHRVRVRYDGFGRDSSHDFWCNFQAEDLYPIGWCAQNGFPLQPPHGIQCTLEEWRTFLTQTLAGALAAPRELFRKEHFQPRVHCFKLGMKIEVIHPGKPSVICPATIVRILSPHYFLVSTDYIAELPTVTFCCQVDQPGIFSPGWCAKNGIELTTPTKYPTKPFSWDKYMVHCRSTFPPNHLFKQHQKPRGHKFKPAFKLEAVDLEQPGTIRVATVTNVMGRILQLFFDGQSRFQFVDCDSPFLYPIGWCKRTGHPLHTNYGKMPSRFERSEFHESKLKLTSFAEVIHNKTTALATPNNQSRQTLPLQTATILPKTPGVASATTPLPSSAAAPPTEPPVATTPPVSGAPPVKTDEIKEDKGDKCQSLSPSDDEDDLSDDEGNGTGSERFYHNKNQIFFNKSCCCGPLLNPDQVMSLPDATEPGKVSTVIRTGLEKVAKCAKDPGKVMDLMQEGSGVRVVLKHEGKVFKKAISRVDSRPKLERYLKRFCRRLVCCEYFLSLTPVSNPCPDKCKADQHGNLQGPKGLKAKRSREYFETKHLGAGRKKRGRKSKSDLAASEAAAQRAAAGIVTTVFHKGDSVPLPNLDLPVTAIEDHLRNTASKILKQNNTKNSPKSENRILPKPVLSTTNETNTTPLATTNPQLPPPNTNIPPPLSMVNTSTPLMSTSTNPSPLTTTMVPSAPNTVPTYGKPRNILPAATLAPVTINDVQIIQPPKKKNTHPVPLRPKTPIVQPQPVSLPQLSVGTVKFAISASKQPLLPLSDTTLTSSGKPVFRLAPPKFQVPPLPCTTNNTTMQSSFSPRLVAVRQPLPRGLNYRLAVSPMLSPNSSAQASVVTSQNTVTTSSSQGRTGPPPLIPARSLGGVISGVVTTHNNTQSMIRPKMNDGYDKKVITAAPNVCVTELGTFVTTQMKAGIHGNTGSLNLNPVVGQSPDANALMNKMFSVVKGGAMPASDAVMKTTTTKSQETKPRTQTASTKRQEKKARNQSPQSAPSGHKVNKVSLSVSGGMGAVTTAVRSGLLSNKEYEFSNGVDSGISITKDGGFSLTINDTYMENACNSAQGSGNKSEEDDDNLWGTGDMWWQRRQQLMHVNGGSTEQENNVDMNLVGVDEDHTVQEAVDSDESLKCQESMERFLMNEKIEPKKGRPPKRRIQLGDVEDHNDPTFQPGGSVSTPKRPKTSPSSLSSTSNNKYPSFNTNNKITTADTNNSNTMPTYSPTHKADLMKGVVPHAVQSSQHPSVKLRSPVGKQTHSINSYPSPSSFKKSRYIATCSPPSKKPHLTYSTNSTFTNSSQKRLVKYSSIGTNTSLPGCPSDACPYHPSDPSDWTMVQVAEYVQATDCKNYATLFLDQEIDGESLVLLSRSSLMQFTNMKLGPTLKLSNYIAQLRARSNR